MPVIEVEGRRVEVAEGTTVLQAARGLGLHIPTLCHHPYVPGGGTCRVCVVEDKTKGRLLTACDTEAEEGMEISLTSTAVLQARKKVLELIFSRHPLHCEVCESGNDCGLKKLAVEAGLTGREMPFNQAFHPLRDANPFYYRDLGKCISCGLCVRACQLVQGAGAYELVGFGKDARPAVAGEGSIDRSDCEFCGLCVSLCPVGALVHKPLRRPGAGGRTVDTVCPFCGVGCGIRLNLEGERIVGVEAGVPGSVNGYSLCVKGRYGLDFVHHPDRLRRPLLRRKQGFEEVSWEEALHEISSRMKDIIERRGPDSVAFLSSAKATNEENYLLQKMARAAVGTNNVDHCARL